MFKYILFKTFNSRHRNRSVPNIIQYASSRAFGQLRGRVIIDYRKICWHVKDEGRKKQQYRDSRISFAFSAVTF